MKLEDLYKNFGESSEEEQQEYLADYRLRRAQDLETVPQISRTKSDNRSKIELTSEEEAAMKALGLSKKDMLALRQQAAELINEEDDEGLLEDESFAEEEDE